MKKIRWLLGLFLVAGMASIPAYTQTQQGDIVGTVRDAQGGVVPGAAVKIINEATAATRTVESDSQGEYIALGFFPGSYRVEVEKSGFERAAVPGVRVDPQTKRRVDVTLQVGAVRAEVTVTGAAPVVKTEGATINSDLPRVMFDKPMNNNSRSGWTFDTATFMPGSAGGRNALFLWGGVIGSQQEIQVEGAQQSIVLFTAPSSTEEMSIVMGTPPAEYARSVQANVTFRGGSNALHGEYRLDLKNPALDAVNTASGRNARPKGIPQWRHEATLSGPLYIPKVYDGRNKTFFFFDYWRSPYKQYGEATASIPSTRIMNGDFSRYLDTKGNLIAIRDPLTGLPFSGNAIPAARLSSVAKAWIKDIYVDNFGDPFTYIPGLEDTNLNNARAFTGYDGVYWNWVLKVDQNVGTKHVFSYSWNHHNRASWQTNLCAGCYTHARELRYGFSGGDDLPQDRYNLGYTYTPTSRLVNQLRLAVARAGQHGYATFGLKDKHETKGKEWLDRWGIQGITPVDLTGVPVFNIPTWGYSSVTNGSASFDTRYQGYENLTYIVGRHSIKTGVSVVKYMQDNTVNPGFGSFNFDGRFTGEPFADLLLGLPATFSRAMARPSLALRIIEYAAYVQDEFRASPKLTLSYGVRWDRYIAPYDKNGMWYNFDPASGKIVVPNQFALDRVSPLWPTATLPVVLASSLGYPEKLINSNQRWLPRFGFGYRPTGSSNFVIRGGIGIYNAVFRFGGLQTGGPFQLTEAYDNSLAAMRAFPNPFGAAAGAATGVATGASVAKDFRPDYLTAWNLTVEKQLLPGWGLRVSYMGNKSTQVGNRFNMNTPLVSTQPFAQSRRPYPGFSGITRIENGVNAHYNALQVVLHHPFRNGLLMEVSYQRQRGIDDGGGGGLGLDGPRDTSPYSTLDYAWNRSRDRARNVLWPTHDFLVNYAYELPLGPGKRWLSNTAGNPGKWVLARVVGGWSTTGYFNWHSGNFFTPRYTGYDPGNLTQFSGRPDVVPGCNLYPAKGQKIRSNTVWFNDACFTPPANGTLGNAPINMLEGPAQWLLTLNPYKEFRIPGWEQGRLTVGAWIYNIFNNTAYWAFSGGTYGSYSRQADGTIKYTASPSGTYLTPWYVRRGTEGVYSRKWTFMAKFTF